MDELKGRIEHLEDEVDKLREELWTLTGILRNHLIRVKNHEPVSDDLIEQGLAYQDLSPERAQRLYQNPDFNFILVDVSSEGFHPPVVLPEAIRIPWEQFHTEVHQLQSKTKPILIISEDGTHSVLACEYLVRRGFYNCSNISGGYRYWRSAQVGKLESA